MSAVENQARSSPGCLNDESLAAYVDGRLDPAERRAVEVHASQCSRCRELLVETAAFVEEDTRGRNPSRFRVIGPKAALLAAALAATVVLLVRITFLSSRQPATASRPELAGLVAAAAHEPTRLVEGRLTGGFAYKPPPVPTRGAGARNVSPEVKIAAAQIEQGAKRRESAASDAALGTSYLAVGNVDNAVDYLETAVQEHPDDARYQNDLSVAYIARATAAGRADDWPKALAAAERAAARDPHLVEACFNRALALEGMTLASDAADAWTACAQADAGSPWATEARARAKAIRDRLEAGKNRPRSRQEDREEIEDRVLVRWAETERAGAVGDADGALADAQRMADALADAGGDTMARDEVALIRRSPRGSTARADLVEAHLAYGHARAAFLREALGEASTEMSAAEQSFAAAGSAYRYWGPIFRAIPLWIQGSGDASLRELASIPLDRLPSSYYHLRGRVAWTKGTSFQTSSGFDRARTEFAAARDLFHRAGELEYESTNAFYLAEMEWFLGNRQRLWQLELDAIRRVDDLPSGSRRRAILLNSAIIAAREGYPEAGLAFLDHLIYLTRSDSRASDDRDPNIYLRQGELFGRLNDFTSAVADFSRAEAAAARMPDQRLRDWTLAEINTARSEVLVDHDARGAIAAVDSALSFHQRTSGVVRTSELLVLRGRAREVIGDFATATRDYEAAISALERDENGITAPEARKAAFDQQRNAVTEAVRFAAVARRDPDAAVWIAERARARVLRNRLGGTSAAALNPITAHKELPKDVAVVYYAALRDRVLGWLFTRSESVNFTIPIDAGRLQLTVRRLDRRIAADAALDDVRDELRSLQPLIEPALSHMPPRAMVVVIPDVGLARIPFAALSDEHGAPLIATHPIVFAPSFTTFVLASERLANFVPDGVVAIGDGHDPKATGLPRLPHADDEATEVARLYTHGTAYTGAQATIGHFLAAGQPVIHFAGHTIANPEFPHLSRLLFATDSRDDHAGVFLASEVSAHQFTKTAVVVLASCQSADGTFIAGEGFDSVSRMFLDAGVPSVVGSLWSVDDDQNEFLVEFHRQLVSIGDAARAVRAAQLKIVGERITTLPIRRWAGFIAAGGEARFVQGGH